MKRKALSLLPLLLIFTMLLSMLAACKDTAEDDSSGTESAESIETAEPNSESSTEKGSETESESFVETEVKLEGENAELIIKANELANGVSPYYSDSARTAVTIDNTIMSLDYRIQSRSQSMQVARLSTPDGNNYITDTMDVFVRMKNGNTYYSSKSLTDAKLNIYRYGYYYYENRIEGQNFINSIEASKEMNIDHTDWTSRNSIKAPRKLENGNISYRTSTGSDPWIKYGNVSFKAEEYDYLEITMKVGDVSGNAELFIISGSYDTYTGDQMKAFTLIDDGEFHTYRIPLCEYKDYTGTVKGLRFDINTKVNGEVEISKIRVFKIAESELPAELTIQRSFLTYSDKLHHLVQFSTPEAVSDIDSVGMITNISADTVEKLIVKDKNGLKETLDGVDWASAEYVGFDIKEAGIFGYIMPFDNQSGSLEVSLKNGVYSIVQTVVPNNNSLIPSTIGSRNKNDLFFGQRIYNDEYHTFDAFIHEAECERHPLTEENIKVNIYQDGSKFLGYQALLGYYKFAVTGTGFNQAYFTFPNRQYRVSFSVTGDQYDRQMYFSTCCTSSGSLESAVLLNEVDMLLPIPIEVSKNFAGDGENTIYNLDDAAYGETFFPMIIKANEIKEYTLTNLYQNWGIFPLKQISSIQFHTPYYHLSTGVTETNCIVPLAAAGPGLPDHRAMSAPFWPTQPQHNSGGGHAFLRYTDNDDNYNASNNTSCMIDSYGPTYCDITLGYDTYDGKISATYTHTEMPQLDENRAFYEMTYVFNEDLSFKDFASQFTFYNVTDNNPKGTYKKVGYLDANNKSQVVNAIQESGKSAKYILGTECPYFTFFDMPDYNPEYKHAFGYTNLSMLIYNYEIIVNGKAVEANFVLTNTLNYLKLSLDLGEVTFKKGDTITVNAILLPWGSQESDYSGEEPDGNVREVRRNTLLNPLKATAGENSEIIESVFVPKIKSTNGKSAEFTVSGGNDNVVVRVYGFDMLSVPKIEELVDGKWVEYKVNSISKVDDQGYGYHYDGYMVHYDGDGTYSYSFVITMENGAPRTFRLAPDESFKGWPKVVIEEEEKLPDPINVYVDASEFKKLAVGSSTYSKIEMAEDGSYIRFYPNPEAREAYHTPYSSAVIEYADLETTGQYLVIKYRAPKDLPSTGQIQFFCSTEQSSAFDNGDSFTYSNLLRDGEWHTLIIDLSKKIPKQFKANDEGTYYAKFLRFDIFNSKGLSAESYLDIAYIGLCDSLSKLVEMNTDLSTVTLIEGDISTEIDTSTGKEVAEPDPVFVDPSSGYTMNEIPFGSWLDYLNGATLSKGVAHDKAVNIIKYNNTTIAGSLITLSGWAIAEGGVEKYVWSADGGKTWNEAPLYKRSAFEAATDAHFAAVTDISTTNYVIKDQVASNVNVRFQGNKIGAESSGIVADLSTYAGQTVDLTFAAVPKANNKSLCILVHLQNVEVLAPTE